MIFVHLFGNLRYSFPLLATFATIWYLSNKIFPGYIWMIIFTLFQRKISRRTNNIKTFRARNDCALTASLQKHFKAHFTKNSNIDNMLTSGMFCSFHAFFSRNLSPKTKIQSGSDCFWGSFDISFHSLHLF